jgi:AcrR family transcriptional regulator
MMRGMTEPDIAVASPRDRAPGRREQKKRENRALILRAARTVFAELGFESTTVRDIVRPTGLASGTFYNYFRTKEEVFEALLDEAAMRIRPRLHAVRLEARSFTEFLEATFRTFLEDVAADGQMFAIMRRNSGCLRVRMDSAEVSAALEELRQDIAQAVAQGLAPAVDVDYLTGAIVGVAFETADRMMQRQPVAVEEAVRFAAAMIAGGVAALSTKERPGPVLRAAG